MKKIDTPKEEIQASIIAQLQSYSKKIGRPIIGSDITEAHSLQLLPSKNSILKYFPSLRNACESADVPHEIHSRGITKERVISDLRKLFQLLGRTPNAQDIKDASVKKITCSLDAITTLFGSLEDARETAGLQKTLPTNTNGATKEGVIKDLQGLHRKLKVPLTRNDIRELYGDATLLNLFGAIEAACEIAEVPYAQKQRNKYSREILITQLNAVANELGRIPTYDDICNADRTIIASHAVFLRYFTTYEEALFEAGLLSAEQTLKQFSRKVIICSSFHRKIIEEYIEMIPRVLGPFRVWINKEKEGTVTFADLVQEGALGAIEAVVTFEEDKGYTLEQCIIARIRYYAKQFLFFEKGTLRKTTVKGQFEDQKVIPILNEFGDERELTTVFNYDESKHDFIFIREVHKMIDQAAIPFSSPLVMKFLQLQGEGATIRRMQVELQLTKKEVLHLSQTVFEKIRSTKKYAELRLQV